MTPSPAFFTPLRVRCARVVGRFASIVEAGRRCPGSETWERREFAPEPRSRPVSSPNSVSATQPDSRNIRVAKRSHLNSGQGRVRCADHPRFPARIDDGLHSGPYDSCPSGPRNKHWVERPANCSKDMPEMGIASRPANRGGRIELVPTRRVRAAASARVKRSGPVCPVLADHVLAKSAFS